MAFRVGLSFAALSLKLKKCFSKLWVSPNCCFSFLENLLSNDETMFVLRREDKACGTEGDELELGWG